MTVCKTHDARRLHLVHRSRTLRVCLFTNKQCECNTRHFEEIRDNLAGYRLIRTDSLSTLWVICLSVQFGHHIKRFRISNVKCVGIWFVHVEYGRSVFQEFVRLGLQVIDLIETQTGLFSHDGLRLKNPVMFMVRLCLCDESLGFICVGAKAKATLLQDGFIENSM